MQKTKKLSHVVEYLQAFKHQYGSTSAPCRKWRVKSFWQYVLQKLLIFFKIKKMHNFCSSQILFTSPFLLTDHHTNIFHHLLSICPSIQTRLKCELDIWCCDVSDNTAPVPSTHPLCSITFVNIHKNVHTQSPPCKEKGTVRIETQ